MSWTAEVAVSADGRYVYGSNRGDDSLVVFATDASTGRLTVKGHTSIGGKYPRHFTVDPTGRFILAGHQNSGTIAVLRLDPASGMPSLVGSPVKVDKPVCLLPVPKR
jgi:6-phosphogluconolactonase